MSKFRLILLLLPALLLSSCLAPQSIKGNIVDRFHYSLSIHPSGDNSIAIRVESNIPAPESVEWIDILLHSFQAASYYALDVDYLVVILPRQPYGGEKYRLHSSYFTEYQTQDIDLATLFTHITTLALDKIPDTFFP